MLNEAGEKPSKAERKAQAAREQLIRKVFGDEKKGSGYADPAAMFGIPSTPQTQSES